MDAGEIRTLLRHRNSDLGWGSIFMHVCNTGGAGSMQVMGYNAGNATYKGDMYVNAFAWLTK